MIELLDEMEKRAQRHLDGMTVNKDAMAKDVIALTKAMRRVATRMSSVLTDQKSEKNTFQKPPSPFSRTFDDIFKDIWKK